MQMHQAQVPFPKMPTATMSREDLTSQKPSALPLDQVRAARESRAEMQVFLFPMAKGLRCLMRVGRTGGSCELGQINGVRFELVACNHEIIPFKSCQLKPPPLVLPLPELVQERTDFMKTKATHDLDNGEEGQALLPRSPRPSSMELPGSVEHGAVPAFVLGTRSGAGPQPAEQLARHRRAPQTSGFP